MTTSTIHLRLPPPGSTIPSWSAGADRAIRALPTAADDLSLARRANAGDAAANRQFVAALAPLPSMLRVKNARLGTPLRAHELEDVVQNTVLAVLRKLDQFDGRVPLLRWAYGFGVIEVLRAIERRARRREQEHKVEPVVEPPPEAVDRERVTLALAALAADDRTVIELRHFGGPSFEAVADRMAMPLSTTKSRYYRGLQRLRDRVRSAEIGTDVSLPCRSQPGDPTSRAR